MRTWLLLFLLLLSPLMAWAQDGEEYLQIEIAHSKPESVLVRPGQKPDLVRLYGRGFELVQKVEIHRKGAKMSHLTGTLRVVSQGIADLEVKADANAAPGDDYTLVLFTPSKSYPMEFLVEVIDPADE